jgi:ATP-dependent protease ClpP protease subunit
MQLFRMASSNHAELYIYDAIGDDFWGEGITAKSITRALKEFGNVDTITVRINSPGGSVFDGNAIYNALNRHPARVLVEVDALAASAASVIAMAGDEIRVAKNALVMIHNAAGATRGEAKDHEKTAEVLRKISESAADIYVARTGRTKDEVIAWMDDETWFTSDEALEHGFATNIFEPKKREADAPSQRWKPQMLDATVHHVLPPRVTAQLRALGMVPSPNTTMRGGTPSSRSGAPSASVPTALGRLAAEPRARVGDLNRR